MSTGWRRVILLCLGILGGVAAWPLTELIVGAQGSFPSYLLFVAALGAAVGLLMGAFFGSAAGIFARVGSRIVSGMIIGAIVGLIGGIIGLLIGQAALFLIGGLFLDLDAYRSFQTVGLPVARAIGWAFLGIFVGAAEGLRAFSGKKIGIGIVGGLIGGLVGGAALEYSRLYLPPALPSRLIGLIVLGMAIALFYGIIERTMAFGTLRVLNGRLKGKEFILNEGRIRIGRAKRNQITLEPYENLADRQAQIRFRKGEALLTNLEPKYQVLVNDQPVKEHRLKYEDVLKIGSAKLFYSYE
jgi:MFS family permease